MRDLEGKFWALKRNEKKIRTVVEVVEEGKGDPERSKEPPSLLAGVTLGQWDWYLLSRQIDDTIFSPQEHPSFGNSG